MGNVCYESRMPLSELLNLCVCEVGKGVWNSWRKLFSRGDVDSCFRRSLSFFRSRTISVAATWMPSTFNGKLKSCGGFASDVFARSSVR